MVVLGFHFEAQHPLRILGAEGRSNQASAFAIFFLQTILLHGNPKSSILECRTNQIKLHAKKVSLRFFPHLELIRKLYLMHGAIKTTPGPHPGGVPDTVSIQVLDDI